MEHLFDALNPPTRQWSPWAKPTVKAQFRDRLERASRGELKPVDEIKMLRSGLKRLFEIRWQDIAVMDRSQDGQFRPAHTNARLIHVEPDALGIALLGLVGHEKPNSAEGAAAQDGFIDQAEHLYESNHDCTWGVTPRD